MNSYTKYANCFRNRKFSCKIYIDNPGFVNRGDQLMIQAVLEQIRHYRPDAQVLVQERAFRQNPTYCIKNNIYPLFFYDNWIKRSRFYAWLVNTLLLDNWINFPRDVDLILDCRGYHLADWRIDNAGYVKQLSEYYRRFTKKGKRLILLPQAFGPFDNTYSKDAVKMVYDNADIIFAREKVSYDYLNCLFQDSKKIKIVPDFTCLTAPSDTRTISLPHGSYVLLIPNYRMMEQTDYRVASFYVDFLVTVTSFLIKIGQRVYLLNHEGEKDEQLLHAINARLDNPLPILTNLSGLEIKALIRDSRLVISGRYHGVVSGLTQGKPTLCTGWSHKYAELLKEHGCSGNILNVDNIPESLSIIKDALANPNEYISKSGCEEKIESDVTNMWKQIFE